MKKIISFLLVLVMVFSLAACGGNSGNGGGGKDKVATKITITSRRSRVQIGTTLELGYTLSPAGTTVESVTWSVNDSSYGTISDQGVFTASDKAGVVKITVTTNTGLSNTKAIQVTTEAVEDYPDLAGYTIKIAQATVALGEWDVFLEQKTAQEYGYYDKLDRTAKQTAWREVENDFNCTIAVVEYPSDAAWGPSRWSYILNQARLDSPAYDFYVVPDAQIPDFVSGNAILDLTDWYEAYGNNSMTQISKTAGSYKNHLYSINTLTPNIYTILGYNVGLWEEINKQDPSIEEPAKMFNDGNWDYSTFETYCIKCQAALNSIYGAESGYYCLSGWPTFYWVGMVDGNGTGVADVANMKMNLTTDDCTAAGDTLKHIFENGAFDPSFNVDGSVQSWTAGRSLFNTGELWFIGANQGRWDLDMWGDGDQTRYGFVPFPAPDGYDRNHTYMGLVAEACLVMASRRQNAYKGYGDDCNAENIYRALMTYFVKAIDEYKGEADYDPNKEYQRQAEKFFATTESQKAFITVSENLYRDGFYDPLASNSNTIVPTYASDFDIAIRNYIKGTGASSWAEAVGVFQTTLDESILKAFG